MTINTKKCAFIHFGNNGSILTYYINGEAIIFETTIKDLGIQVDNKLLFRKHLQTVIKKASKLIGLCFHLFHSNDANLYLSYFNSYILLIIDYGSILYLCTHKSSIQQIEKLQQRFTRLLFKRTHRSQPKPDYFTRLKLFGLQKLHNRYLTIDLIALFKILTGRINTPSLHFRFSSNCRTRILLPSIRLNSSRNSFPFRSISLWNTFIKQSVHSLPELKRIIDYK